MNRRRATAPLLAALLLVGCGGGRGGGGGDESRVNVLLVTLDTTRADRLGCYGNERIETPHLDRLAREGVLFEQAFSAVPSTLPSHCTILTGMLPPRHGVHDNGVYELAEDISALPERFREEDYRTAAFVSAFVLDRQFGLDQGFEVYDDQMELPLLEGDPRRIQEMEGLSDDERRWLLQQASPYQRRAEAVTGPALEWLAEHAGEPFFLWVHYFDPHMDYTPPPPWNTRYDPEYAGELDGRDRTWALAAKREGWGSSAPLPEAERQHMIALYDGEVSYMDEWVGRLFAGLEAAGVWDETLVVVVADHGEGFGEHGQLWEHNGQVFDEVVRVPLILKLPAGLAAGRRVGDLARTVDLAPTVLDVTGLPALSGIQGISLAPLARGDPGARAPLEVDLQTLRERQASPSEFSWLGLRTERYKLCLVLGEDDELLQSYLFDLAADPGETRPIVGREAERVSEWSARVRERYDDLKALTGAGAFRGMSELTSEALSSLGYTK